MAVSSLTHYLFTNHKVDLDHDYLDVYTQDARGGIRPKRDRNLQEEIHMEDLKYGTNGK